MAIFLIAVTQIAQSSISLIQREHKQKFERRTIITDNSMSVMSVLDLRIWECEECQIL